MIPSEAKLLAAFRAGDRQAFDTLFHAYAGRVQAFARQLTGNRAEAEDLTQEVFLAAFRGAERFHGQSRLLTWLFAIAMRRWRDRQRGPQAPLIAYQDILIDQADPAWKDADFARFAANWDFDYLGQPFTAEAQQAKADSSPRTRQAAYAAAPPQGPQNSRFHTERAKFWEHLVQQQRGKWKSWHTGIKWIKPVSIFTGAPDAYEVHVFSNVRCAGRNDMHEFEFNYYVRRTPDGWRIIDWNPYIDTLRQLHTTQK